MMKWLGISIVVVLVLVGAWLGYRHWSTTTEAKAAEEALVTAKVERRDIEQTVRSRGTIKAPLTTEVKAQIDGMTARVLPTAGATVKKGDLLLELNKSELESQINESTLLIQASKLRSEKAQLDLNRQQKLFDSNLLSQKDYDEAKLNAQLAQNEFAVNSAKVETLRQQLAKTSIMAPHDGTVLKVDVQEGQVITGAGSVSSGTTLMTVADLRKLQVDADLDEIDIGKLSLDMPVHLTLDSIPGLEIEGKIKFISPQAIPNESDKSIHNFPIIVTLLTTDPRIKVGLTANLKIPITQVKQAPSLPISMVFEDQTSSYVFVRQNGATLRRDVKTGINDNSFVEIKSGLNEGETVTLNPVAGKPAKNVKPEEE